MSQSPAFSTVSKKYSVRKGAVSVIESASSAVQQILAMEQILEKHKRELLSAMIWKISEANGKWNTRYFSENALNNAGARLQHEHVVTRKSLIDKLLARPEDFQTILEQIIACVVTTDDHKALSMFDSEEGWERYKKAGLKVWDRQTEQWLWEKWNSEKKN